MTVKKACAKISGSDVLRFAVFLDQHDQSEIDGRAGWF
jgi:hypothetical protein